MRRPSASASSSALSGPGWRAVDTAPDTAAGRSRGLTGGPGNEPSTCPRRRASATSQPGWAGGESGSSKSAAGTGDQRSTCPDRIAKTASASAVRSSASVSPAPSSSRLMRAAVTGAPAAAAAA